jgi:hypothetical protein
MEKTQGNSLYAFLYLKLTKSSCFTFYILQFFSTNLENRRAELVLLGGVGIGTSGRGKWWRKGVGG